MKKIIALFAFLILANTAHADGLQGIAVIDVHKVTAESKAGKSLQEKVKQLKQKFDKEYAQKDSSIRDMDQKLAADQPKLKPEEFEKRRKELEKSLQAAQKEIGDKRMTYEKAVMGARNQLQTALMDVIKDMSDKNGYKLVVPNDLVILKSPELDVTDQVIKALDQKITDVQLQGV